MRPWQWCGKQHHGVGKVLAKGRATSETQQGEKDRSVHTSLYHHAGLPLCPAHFGVVTNYIVSPKNWSPKNRRSSVISIFHQHNKEPRIYISHSWWINMLRRLSAKFAHDFSYLLWNIVQLILTLRHSYYINASQRFEVKAVYFSIR